MDGTAESLIGPKDGTAGRGKQDEDMRQRAQRRKSKGKKGKRNWKLNLWRYRDVYHRLCVAAHKWGLRVHQVCAWGTSQLAFDGSGRVNRGKYIMGDDGKSLGLPYSVVRFSSGKFYNADLNAAYNIGARYYIRLLLDFLKAHLSSEDFGVLLANERK